MSFLSGELTVQCVICNSTISVDSGEVDFDTSTIERGMGPEHIYDWEAEVECSHLGCENVMAVEYSISEYPEGVLNFNIINVEKGRIIKGFNFDFSSDDINDD